MLIIPAIDIYGGKCVRLRQGQFDRQTVYSSSPAAVARSFLEAGFPFLHVVDLDGAKAGRITNWDSLKSILKLPGVRVEVGGGVRSHEEIRELLRCGAKRVVIGSVAVTLPSLVKKWIHEFGPSHIAIALDIRQGKLAHGGWLDEAELSLNTFMLEMISGKANTFICTDIDRDGTLEGPNLDLYREIQKFFNEIELIASGGISSIEDLRALEEVGVSGAVIGKALYEGNVRLDDVREFGW